MFPDSQTAQATHTAVLKNLPLPIEAKTVHFFNHLASGSLLALGPLCDAGCIAYFDKDTCYITHEGEVILKGIRKNATGLWKINTTPPAPATKNNNIISLNSVIDRPTMAERIKFLHAALFSPTLDTLSKALTNNFLVTFPTFTAQQLRKYPPRSKATVQGHLRALPTKQKRVKEPSPSVNQVGTPSNMPALIEPDTPAPLQAAPATVPHIIEEEDEPPTSTLVPRTLPLKRTKFVYPTTITATGRTYSDQSGAFLIPSTSGMKYLFILYDYDSNLIWATPLPSRTKEQILKAYKSSVDMLAQRGFKPVLQRMDNECSQLLKDFMTNENIQYELTPAGKHGRNAAEKAIQTFKDHFIAGLSSTNPSFPIAHWDKLIPQANITLNLLRPSRLNPSLSAYHQIFGAFDYNKTPLAPPGMEVLAHLLPEDRRSFDPHAVKAYSVGPAMNHYRCHRVLVKSTGRTRISDTLRWFPHGNLKLPIPSKHDLLQSVLQDLRATLKSTMTNGILPPLGTESRKTLEQLHDLFQTKPSRSPEITNHEVPRVLPTATSQPPRDVPRVPSNITEPPHREVPRVRIPPTPPRRSMRTSKPTQSSDYIYANATVELSPAEEEFVQDNFCRINAVLDPSTGKMQEYRDLIKTKDKELWQDGAYKELARLAQGRKKGDVQATNTIQFIPHTELPKHKKATYARICANYRPQKADPYRIRITVGGDRIEYNDETYTPTADITTGKTLFNSVVSTPGSKFLGIDISDFYLMTTMDDPEYMWMPRWIFPQAFIDEYNLEPLFINDRILTKIIGGMYGLPQAGRLAYIDLIKFLQRYGYVRAGLTPGLFKHITRPTIFSLVVDDFGVKYNSINDALHLINTLKIRYKITVDWEGSIFCGIHLNWNYQQGEVTLSMPNYVNKALQRFNHQSPTRPQHSPHPYTTPNYGAKVQYAQPLQTTDLTPAQKKYVQQVLGVFLFYARAIDSTMLAAVGTMAASLSTARWADIQPRIAHFLDYAATHPDAQLVYRHSDMHLWSHTDASYLTEPKARSRAGGYHFFSDKPLLPLRPDSPAPMHNHPVLVVCKMIERVMSSTQEAETGGGYINARELIPLRQTAIEMGHPQGPTPLQFDNKCAHGILTGELKQKQSKCMDMRYYWLRDRALEQKQLHVHWKRGDTNLGDYTTKHHPTQHHVKIRPTYVANQLTLKSSDLRTTLYAVCKGVLKSNPPTLHGYNTKQPKIANIPTATF